MLRAISERGGEATTTEIRDVTGLTNSQVAYRREKLREYGLITVRTGESTGSRTPPKTHSLTETAQTHVEAGLFDLYTAPVTGDVKQLSTQVNHLRDRVDELAEAVERVDENVEKLRTDLTARVGNYAEIQEATEGEKLAIALRNVQTELADLRENVTELEERKRNKLFR